MVIGLHGYGGHSKVGAIDGDHGGLRQASLVVVFLNHGVDRYGGDYEQDDEIHLDLISCSLVCEIAIRRR